MSDSITLAKNEEIAGSLLLKETHVAHKTSQWQKSSNSIRKAGFLQGSFEEVRSANKGEVTTKLPFLRPIQPPSLIGLSRASLIDYFDSAWRIYEWLYSGLDCDNPEIQNYQPNPLRNSLAFYYGHTAAFYACKLSQSGLLKRSVSDFERFMSVGVWPKSASELTHEDLPGFGDLSRYRKQVYEEVIEAINTATIPEVILQNHPLWGLLMAIEHDLIHFQTNVPHFRRTPLSYLEPPKGWSQASHSPAQGDVNQWQSFSGGPVSLGRELRNTEYYGWDNEFGKIQTFVESFQIKSTPVTNREYFEFVASGAYECPEFWTSPEVDVWFETYGPEAPASWIKDERGSYRYRAPFEETEMPWDWPVEVCKHEAVAYANWAGARPVSEPEYHYLIQTLFGSVQELTVHQSQLDVALRQTSLRTVGQCSVDDCQGIDLFGNVALWSSEAFQPICETAFKSHPLYPDFSRPWFRGDHSLLLGAGYTSLGHTAQIGWMRDFMQNHMDQVAGIALVREV